MRKVTNVHVATWRFIGAFLPLLFSYENIPVLHNVLDVEVQSIVITIKLLVEYSNVRTYQISDGSQ